MSKVDWAAISDRLNEHSYMQGVERTVQRVTLTAEVFTPTELVIDMLKRLPSFVLGPGRTVLDPACGDGQFLVAAKWIKIIHFGMTEGDALSEIYGIDIMRDNVDLCVRRLGGGTIVMGDTLRPSNRMNGQTTKEHELMIGLFGSERQQILSFDAEQSTAS